jgi:hypothetical protein
MGSPAIIGDTFNAKNIWSGYDWGSVGFSVIEVNGDISKLQIGDIYCVKAFQFYNGATYTNEIGHTGIIASNDGTNITVYEQNFNFIQTVQHTNSNWAVSGITHVVRKV